MNRMKIVEFTPKEFEQLEDSWRLLERGKDMTAFQSFEWCRNVNKLYFKERAKRLFRKWIYFLILENDRPVLIAPLCFIKVGVCFSKGEKHYGLRKGCYFIGRSTYSDYLNFIYDEFSEKAMDSLFSYLETKYKIKHFTFEQMITETQSFNYIDRHFATNCSSVSCAALHLPQSFEEYHSSLTKSVRQNIRTAINRANKNQILLTHCFTYDESDDTKEKLLEIRKQRLYLKKGNPTASLLGKVYNGITNTITRCFSSSMNIMYDSKNTWYFLVKDGERIVSFFWGIRNDEKKELYTILSGVDEDYTTYSPNISHFYLFLQEYYVTQRNDIAVFDFTRGGEKYKKDIGCQAKLVFNVDFSV